MIYIGYCLLAHDDKIRYLVKIFCEVIHERFFMQLFVLTNESMVN